MRKEKENEPFVPSFATLRLRMSECRRRVRERERWQAENRGASVLSAWGWTEETVAVIPGSLRLDIGREGNAMVRNGECGAEQRNEEKNDDKPLESMEAFSCVP